MPERSGKNVRRCQKYFRWYVRNYIRMVCQGRDHSKKVISIVRLAPPKGTTWAVFEPCLVDDEFGDCTSQHTGDNNNIIIISRYLIILKGNPVLHQPIVSFCWHFHVLPATCSSPWCRQWLQSQESQRPASQCHCHGRSMTFWHWPWESSSLMLRLDMFGLFHPGPAWSTHVKLGVFPPTEPKVISAACHEASIVRMAKAETQNSGRTLQILISEHSHFTPWLGVKAWGNGTFLGH